MRSRRRGDRCRRRTNRVKPPEGTDCLRSLVRKGRRDQQSQSLFHVAEPQCLNDAAFHRIPCLILRHSRFQRPNAASLALLKHLCTLSSKVPNANPLLDEEDDRSLGPRELNSTTSLGEKNEPREGKEAPPSRGRACVHRIL